MGISRAGDVSNSPTFTKSIENHAIVIDKMPIKAKMIVCKINFFEDENLFNNHSSLTKALFLIPKPPPNAIEKMKKNLAASSVQAGALGNMNLATTWIKTTRSIIATLIISPFSKNDIKN